MEKASQILFKEKDIIVEEWEERVNSKIDASRRAQKLSLRDHVPAIIDDIIQILDSLEEINDISQQSSYREILGNSVEHGRHRATTELYSVDQVIHEYIILHQVINDTLNKAGNDNLRVYNIAGYIIEMAILNSCVAFSESLEEMQHKLVGTIAHDIRSPLTIAYTSLQILESDNEDFESIRRLAINSLKKGLNLTEELLDAVSVRAGEGMMLNFDHGDFITEISAVKEEAARVYARNIILTCPYKKIKGVLDGVAIRRALENLITNAVKYGSVKSPITIDIKDAEALVEVSVHNIGIPITKEKIATIFDFLKLGDSGDKPTAKSWGMGLALVKMVAESHGGQVFVESNEKDGTKFTMKFQKNSNQPGRTRARLS